MSSKRKKPFYELWEKDDEFEERSFYDDYYETLKEQDRDTHSEAPVDTSLEMGATQPAKTPSSTNT